MILALLALLAPARAEDPWGRPTHLRAVAAPPADWAALRAGRRPVRLWWDAAAEGAEVQRRRGRRWVTVARGAAPGWTSGPVPRGTAFRVRLGPPGAPRRWSPVVEAPPWASPTDLARLGAPAGAQLGERTGQVRGAPGQGVWASTLGGGAVRLDPDTATGSAWTRWEGLPDDRVIDVALDGERVLLGTAGGALLVEGGAPVRTWSEELPSAWVQAVALEAGWAWLGTDAGLVRVAGADAPERLTDAAIHALAPARGGGVWAGAGGLLRSGEEAVRALPGEHLYDLEEGPGGLWIASQEAGLVQASPAGVAGAGDGRAAYGVAVDPRGGAWVARGEGGLSRPDGAALGRAAGLPADTVWAVEVQGDRAWVGTEAGAVVVEGAGAGVRRVPVSPWPADRAATALLVGRRGAFIAGPRGVTRLGRPHPAADDLVVAAPVPVAALLEDDAGGTWAVGAAAVRLDRRGALHRVELPGPARAAAWWRGALWVAVGSGLWQLDPGDGAAAAWLPTGPLDRLVAAPDAVWGLAEGAVLRLAPQGPRPFLALRRALDLAPDGDGVWVGTVDGLARLVAAGPREGEVEDPLGPRDAGWQVAAVAADGRGGCWLATADGRVGRLWAGGRYAEVRPVALDPPRPLGIAVEPGGEAAWVMTEAGTWRVALP